ncbi:hypothetical protein [Desulfovibrio cuneatus]|uniref:hypothetical protein n=1 Tax=Desulfovibrio cuneatus TaxID=159728 RepID=UPI000422DA96|nr:hypothetical protein [Desulfovibrio cuneatus]
MRKYFPLFRRIALVCLCASTLAGCAHDAKLKPALEAMHTINDATRTFGPPSKVVDLPDGTTTYVWSAERARVYPGQPVVQRYARPAWVPVYDRHGRRRYAPGYAYDTAVVGYTPDEVRYSECELRIQADSVGRILSSSYQGNSCDDLLMSGNVVVPGPAPIAEQPAQPAAAPASAPEKENGEKREVKEPAKKKAPAKAAPPVQKEGERAAGQTT